MHRFYLPSPDIHKDVVDIRDPRIVFQLTKVLRLRKGERFRIFDETGKEWVVQALEADRKRVVGNLIETVEEQTEPEFDVHLYQAIPKKTALFELVIQKATEIGVNHIYPLITQRTEKQRLSKFDRLMTIATEATEQSHRKKIPFLHHPVTFESAISKIKNAYIAYEYEEQKMLNRYLNEMRKEKTIHLFIGPEGGFDQKEIDFAQKQGARLFTFGPRILRTETAALAALSLILLQDSPAD